jgi:hypothetical protein
MGTFCHNFAEDVLSQGRFITKFLGRKIHRTFRPGTFRQGTSWDVSSLTDFSDLEDPAKTRRQNGQRG